MVKKKLKKKTQGSKKPMHSKPVQSFPIQPIADGVLIRPLEKESSRSPMGIIIPDTAEKKESKEGMVVAVGAGKVNDDGKVVLMMIKVGQKVFFRPGWDNEIEIDGVKHFLVSQSDVKAILK